MKRTPTADAHDRATDTYKNIVKFRRTMEFQRSAEKAAAIRRILDSGQATSATAAEKLVESEPEYFAFCTSLTTLIVQEIQSKEELLVARAFRVAEIMSLVTGSVVVPELGEQERVGGPEHAP